jgi:hypothetical protein
MYLVSISLNYGVNPVVEKKLRPERFSAFLILIPNLLFRTIYQLNYGMNPVA